MRKGIKIQEDLVVTEENLPTSVADYKPGDVASAVDIVPNIINSQGPQ